MTGTCPFADFSLILVFNNRIKALNGTNNSE